MCNIDPERISTHMLFLPEQLAHRMIFFYPHIGPGGPGVVYIWLRISSHMSIPNKIILITSMKRTTRIYKGISCPEGQYVGRVFQTT